LVGIVPRADPQQAKGQRSQALLEESLSSIEYQNRQRGRARNPLQQSDSLFWAEIKRNEPGLLEGHTRLDDRRTGECVTNADSRPECVGQRNDLPRAAVTGRGDSRQHVGVQQIDQVTHQLR
jgi:hypothetical protein